MKSSFKIDFADLTGEGIEPIIRIEIGDETTDDKLLKWLFQSTDQLNVHYLNDPNEKNQNMVNKNLILSKSRVFNLKNDR